MLVSEYIAKFIHNQGVGHVFVLTGGMVSHLLDGFYRENLFSIITVHHEQAAAFAVDGYSRVSNIPGVAVATSGPGAVNLLTGIGSCYYDSVPAIFITGQVNTYEQKGENKVRQLGFQEHDILSMAEPICKKVYNGDAPEKIPGILKDAWETAMEGRPGPVLIDIPMNIQRAELPESMELPSKIVSDNKSSLFNGPIQDLIDDIQKAQRPLVLAGRGINASGSSDLFTKAIGALKIPVVLSLLGLDTLPYDHPFRLGFIGVYGNRWANIALKEADFLLVIGSRLDIRQTGADTESFVQGKKIYHIDIERNEINLRINGCTPIVADVKHFLTNLLDVITELEFQRKEEWIGYLDDLTVKYPDTQEQKLKGCINPNSFIHELSRDSSIASSYIIDVGNHQMWMAQSVELRQGQNFITSGGMGSMGYSLPAAIGACFAMNKRPVISVSGDGGFQINIQELQTIVRYNLPVKIVILNNKSLGMIRQFQDSYFEKRHISSAWNYSSPDFEKIAVAYGIDSYTVDNEEKIQNGLFKLWEHPERPFLLQVMLPADINAYPKISFGNPLDRMEPSIDEV